MHGAKNVDLVEHDVNPVHFPQKFQDGPIALDPCTHANNIFSMLPVKDSWLVINENLAKGGDN